MHSRDHLFPVIKLTVEGMRHTVAMHLAEHQMTIDEHVERTLEAVCSDGNIAQVVKEAASIAIADVVRGEVEYFFKYGNGRKALKSAVVDFLSKEDKE